LAAHRRAFLENCFGLGNLFNLKAISDLRITPINPQQSRVIHGDTAFSLQKSVSIAETQTAKVRVNKAAPICRKRDKNEAGRMFAFSHQSPGLTNIIANSVTCQ